MIAADRYYITVKGANAYGVLMGPFQTKEGAKAKLHHARSLASGINPNMHFQRYGLTKSARQLAVSFDHDGKRVGKGQTLPMTPGGMVEGGNWKAAI